MSSTWRFALFLTVLLMASRGPSLASEEGGAMVRGDHGNTIWNRTDSGHDTTGDTSHGDSGDSGHDDGGQGDSGHDDSGHDDGGQGDSGHDDGGHDGGGHGETPITTLPIVTWKWHHVSTPYLVALWILVCWLCKLIIEANHHVTDVIPESALLICFGFILGGIIWGADKVQTFKLTPTVFFFYLLPQVILDAGYSMPNKLFFSNLGGILVYAIIGTCWNAASLGLSLWGCHKGGAMGDLDIGLLQYLLFGSLIAAVDPVAVIAVFEQVHVNEVLFIMVFGESLLNDGVTVVLFNVFDAFVSLGGSKIDAVEIIKGIVSFFVVAFGGSLLGFVFGLLISLLTRCTKNIQIIEPGFIFVLGYLSYLTAEMLSLSAILSIVFCGICCQKYINANMDESSVNTVRYAMKVLANGSETIIFVFLGISAIDKSIWVWNTGFILLTLLFVIVYRCIGVFVITWILNKFRLVPIGFIDQVILSYGGLRGAVAYGLAVMLDENKIKEKNLMVSTTLIVVYFTVIFQGITMKPLVTWLKVKRAALSELTLVEKVQNKVFDHMLVAIEDISGQIGHNYMRDKWNNFEENWMSRVLMKPSARKNRDYVFNVFHQLNLKDAMSYVAEGERRGSLEFVRNDTAYVDFKKKFGDEFSEVMPDIMADMSDDHGGTSVMRRDPVPSVSLEMHEQTMNGMRGAEDINTHHLLQQHLYKGRKQHRHRYSRSHFDVNKDENEVQEIFQRTMRSRLESFKSAKMGVAPPKTISKHTKKEPQQKMPNGKSLDKSKSYHSGDEDFGFSEGDSASGYDAPGSFPMRVTYRAGAGIENPAFMADMDPMQIPPWLAEAELDSSTVAPSQRAQVRLPWTPSNLRRLAPLRTSTRSTDSFMLADAPATQQRDGEELPPPPPPPASKRDGDCM
ncbi:sodium/hydrogen exchanger 3-like isoform X1 [Seriola aureovittata]|uniref:sodium/hydrogen exchanger 3-like isoform X1 n=2 Tax=Seriola aureovittata TaxID=2871759 RepID=UPI0024BE5D9D|nr:sodium/hydrogen exchanger 3-like isoform X1 [Seriola aureovittata]